METIVPSITVRSQDKYNRGHEWPDLTENGAYLYHRHTLSSERQTVEKNLKEKLSTHPIVIKAFLKAGDRK